MDSSGMKNVVVLKDLPSNIIDEAIVVLKGNVDAKSIDRVKEILRLWHGGGKNSRDYVVKEAEAVVASYISSIEEPKQLEIVNRKLKKKYKALKKMTAFFAIVAVFGIVVNLI